MDEKLHKVVLGCLLHDIGKVVQRAEKMGKYNANNHSAYGEMYAKQYLKIQDREILDQIAYHHEVKLDQKSKRKGIKEAYQEGIIQKDSLAFIANCADNIAAGCDRRYREDGMNFPGWKLYRALHSIFNCLYEEKNILYRYNENEILDKNRIPFPEDNQFTYKKSYYCKQLNMFLEEIEELSYEPVNNSEYINTLIGIQEKCFTFMAEDTSNAKLADVSLYDHLKMTAAFGSCMYLYAKEQGITDYYKEFLTGSTKFYGKKTFMLVSLELSGIQKFVYSIPSEGALKNLRGRSFYINLLVEYAADEFLKKINLTRANVLYIGGGTATLLVPNLKNTKLAIESFEESINEWLVEQFQSVLHLQCGYEICSAYDFRTRYSKQYKEKTTFTNLLADMQRQKNEKKYSRYSADMIRSLNHSIYQNEKDGLEDGDRECKVCHNTSQLRYDESKDTYYCPVCYAIQRNANKLLEFGMDGDFISKELFLIEAYDSEEKNTFPLPLDSQMRIANDVAKNTNYMYSKNKIKTSLYPGVHFWVADYASENTLEEMAKKAKGIERIAVIRADVDNLGESFINGFTGSPSSIDRDTISRKATYSRMLALFFQYYINGILKNGKYSLELCGDVGKNKKRNAAVVYSGGDDLFIVGGWDDIIGFAVDLHRSFKKYTQGKLSISAGIGIYPPKYPISSIAKETGELELCSKRNGVGIDDAKEKDSITLFSSEFTFHWNCFIEKVLGEKYRLIKHVFDSRECGERGITFLHTLLQLLKNIQKSPVSLARYAFLIARLEPSKKRNMSDEYASYVENYQILKEKLYQWMKNSCFAEKQKMNDENDVKQCIVAIYLYLYLKRKRDGEDGRNE